MVHWEIVVGVTHRHACDYHIAFGNSKLLPQTGNCDDQTCCGQVSMPRPFAASMIVWRKIHKQTKHAGTSNRSTVNISPTGASKNMNWRACARFRPTLSLLSTPWLSPSCPRNFVNVDKYGSWSGSGKNGYSGKSFSGPSSNANTAAATTRSRPFPVST